MIGVDRDTDAATQNLAKVEGLSERIHAGAVAGIHRMQRLDRERHVVGAGVRQNGGNAVGHHAARRADIARILRQAADHEHEALGAERRSLVDCALVVVDRRLPSGFVGGREHAAAAIAADLHSVIFDRANGRIEADGRDLIAPRIDRGDAVPRASLDGFT